MYLTDQADRVLRKSRVLHRLKLDCKDFDVDRCPGIIATLPQQDLGSEQQTGTVPSVRNTQISADESLKQDGRSLSLEGNGMVKRASAEQEMWAGGDASPPPWLCIGKHLCGAATDYALRACLRMAPRAIGGKKQGEKRTRGPAGPECISDRRPTITSDPNLDPLLAEGGSLYPAPKVAAETSTSYEALLTPPEAPCWERLRGLAIAPCCHHRCGWRAYVGKPLFQRLGFSSDEFELMSWMTGWALCGHGTANNGDDSETEGDEGGEGGLGDRPSTRKRCKGLAGGASVATSSPAEANSPSVMGFDSVQAEALAGGMAFLTSELLPRDRRVALGQKCKQLIDQGRLEWLHGVRVCNRAELVTYCEPNVSGENRLLLACLKH